MGSFIIIGLLLILSLAWFFLTFWYEIYLEKKGKRKYYNDYTGARITAIVLAVFLLIGLVGMGLSFVNLERSWEKTELQYNALKETVEYSRTEDLAALERIQVINSINEMNSTIADHRAFEGNFWTGCWYSKRIGNLEFLK